MSYQLITIVGYLGADAETQRLADGTPVTNFSVAVNKRFTNAQGDKVQRTTWFNVALWGERGVTLAGHLTKGTLVLVAGEVSAEAYPDEKTGKPLGSLKLTAGRVQLLSPKPDEPLINDEPYQE